MNLFITKYALSRGIVEAELVASGTNDSGSGMVSVKWEGGFNGVGYFHGKDKDWHETKDGAVLRAYAMRDAKVASLRKQIEKLNHLDFS